MKKNHLLWLLTLVIVAFQCSGPGGQKSQTLATVPASADSVLYSFAFMGCNRVGWSDVVDSVPSTANKEVLERIFADMIVQQPDAFFFLGDLVLAETDTTKLNTQLEAWVKLFENNPFSSSGIEFIAAPGNHEMLYGLEISPGNYKEYPLKYATEVWLQHMRQYRPDDRKRVLEDSVINSLTFSFKRKNVGFIVMNTDTYNPPTKKDTLGFEGLIPTKWVLAEIDTLKNDATVDHIMILSHKPYYVSGQPETGHEGFPEGPTIWKAMEDNEVIALLSAHVHDYQRMQPGGQGPYQIVAGNGGSAGKATFFGYSMINVMSSGKLKFVSRGIDVESPFTKASSAPFTVRDSTTLTWTANANPYQGSEL